MLYHIYYFPLYCKTFNLLILPIKLGKACSFISSGAEELDFVDDENEGLGQSEERRGHRIYTQLIEAIKIKPELRSVPRGKSRTQAQLIRDATPSQTIDLRQVKAIW